MAILSSSSFSEHAPWTNPSAGATRPAAVRPSVMRGAIKRFCANCHILAIAAILVLAITETSAVAQSSGSDEDVAKDEGKKDESGNDNTNGDGGDTAAQDGDVPLDLGGEETIYVMGTFGDSIKESTDKKRWNTSIVEAVSAEDIGKLPDVSIAESIARLPGLAAQRLDGRANVISIRGLAPDFTTTTLNGREQVSANNNRAVEFDQFPAELIHGVTVYKTPDATITSQAVGGTVDLQTVSPLRYGKPALTANLRGEYNDLGALNAGSTAAGYRTSVSYIDQFANDTVGVALGYARMSPPTQEERWNTWGYPSDIDGLDGNFIIGGAKPYVKSNQLIRDGLMTVLEYKPKSGRLSSTVDAYYSRFDDTQLLRGIEIPLAWSGAQLQPGYTVEDGLITSGQFNGVEAVVRNDVVQRDANTVAIGWNTKYSADDNWDFEFDASYSRVRRTESNLETYSGTGRGTGVGATDDLGFTMGENGTGATFSPGLDYSDPSVIQLGGPLSWGYGLYVGGHYPDSNAQDGFINRPSTEDSLAAMKFGATQKVRIPGLDSFQYGMRLSQRRKSLDDEGVFLTLRQYPDDVPIPGEFMLEPTSLGFIGMGDMISYDAQALYDSGAYSEVLESESAIGRSVNSWFVNESVMNSYIMGNINTKIKGMQILGNAGVQGVYTVQHSRGYRAKVQQGTSPDGDPQQTIVRTEVADGDAYWNFLPSLNLTMLVTERQKARLGIAQVLARPRMDQMNAGSSVNYNPDLSESTDINNSPWSGGGGNPHLRPWLTWQFDASYEYYFDQGGYLAAAGYYKRVSSFPFNTSIVRDFTDYLSLVSDTPALTEGLVTVPENTGNGKIYGVELSAAVPFSVLTKSLTGFGALFSASLADSSVKELPEADPIDLPGFSKTVLNGTIYFERAGFQARGSVRYRSKFLGEISGLSLIREQKFVKEETLVDAQLSYDLSKVGAKGLSVLLQGYNLTNQPFTSYHGDDQRLVRDYQNYGRTILLGMTWKDPGMLLSKRKTATH